VAVVRSTPVQSSILLSPVAI